MRKGRLWISSLASLLMLGGNLAWSQETSPIGRVRVGDGAVSGALEVSGGEAVLRGAATVTARERTAELRLERGGEVQVCSTSVLHVTAGPKPVGAPAPLLMGLDRGAMQVHTAVSTRDALVTPDLRFTVTRPGLLNLGLRVVANGDTCVDNRGLGAPVLEVGEQIGGASYQLLPGQHVLFERGSVREVVDHETSPCGCPPVTPPEMVAETGGGGTVLGSTATRPAAEAQHPFPAAESVGLAPGGAGGIPQAPAGQVHAQVGATLAYGDAGSDDGNGMTPPVASSAVPGGSPAGVPAGGTAPATSTGAPMSSPVGPSPRVPSAGAAATRGPNPATPAAVPSQPKPGLFGSIGRFFRGLFH